MKLSKGLEVDCIVSPKEWECFDGCPVCRLFKNAAEKGKLISSVELEKAFANAEAEIDSV